MLYAVRLQAYSTERDPPWPHDPARRWLDHRGRPLQVRPLSAERSEKRTENSTCAPGFGMPPQFPPGYDPSGEQPQQRKSRRNRERVKPADPNAVIDPNMPTDPNVIRENIREFKGLDRDISQVTAGGRTESREWTRPKREDSNLDLARAVNDQVTEEFKFIRELAAEEGAAMTVAASSCDSLV